MRQYLLAAGSGPELRDVSAVSGPAGQRTVQGSSQVSIFWQRQLTLPVPSLTAGDKSEWCFKYSRFEINTFICFPIFISVLSGSFFFFLFMFFGVFSRLMVLCNGRHGCFLLFYVWALCRVERVQGEAAVWLGETALLLLSLWWMADILFPKHLSRDFLALAASKRHCLFQNPAEGTGKYQELENTCIIPS